MFYKTNHLNLYEFCKTDYKFIKIVVYKQRMLELTPEQFRWYNGAAAPLVRSLEKEPPPDQVGEVVLAIVGFVWGVIQPSQKKALLPM